MVINVGLRTLKDGTRECYHYGQYQTRAKRNNELIVSTTNLISNTPTLSGEYFHRRNLPIVSQIALLVFKVHAQMFVWSTTHNTNHYAFAPDNKEAKEMEEQS